MLTEHTLRTPDGADLWWAETARPRAGAPDLLLIAGQATTHRSWLHVLGDLTGAFRVILFDHRGVGQSTLGGREAFTTRELAADALGILDAAGSGSVCVYGHSMGGRIAQWLAIDHPERVSRLVLASTTGGDAGGVPREREASTIMASGNAARMEPLFFGPEFRAEHADVVCDFFARDAPIPVRRAYFEASRSHDAWDHLGRIAAPTLVVHGADDHVTPVGNARRVAEAITGAELHIEPGQAHCPNLESAAVRARVAAWLAVGEADASEVPAPGEADASEVPTRMEVPAPMEDHGTVRIRRLRPAGLVSSPAFSHVAVVPPGATTVYVGGQNAVNERGELVGGGDAAVQARQALNNARMALAAAGASLADVLQWTVLFASGVDANAAYGAIAADLASPEPPLVTAAHVEALAVPGALLEISAVAAIFR